jgi:hypothetical protein
MCAPTPEEMGILSHDFPRMIGYSNSIDSRADNYSGFAWFYRLELCPSISLLNPDLHSSERFCNRPTSLRREMVKGDQNDKSKFKV